MDFSLLNQKIWQDGGKDVSPWIGPDGTILQDVKDQYANTIIVSYKWWFTTVVHWKLLLSLLRSLFTVIIGSLNDIFEWNNLLFFQIDDVNGFDNSIVAPFVERIKEAGMTEKDVDLVSLSSTMETRKLSRSSCDWSLSLASFVINTRILWQWISNMSSWYFQRKMMFIFRQHRGQGKFWRNLLSVFAAGIFFLQRGLCFSTLYFWKII